ncbi:MAG TPA: hypothetical protein VHU17_21355, partial [Acidimicrobiales bacterium]|nr:hypothetical protein [Acidimicrobiales bacterium]
MLIALLVAASSTLVAARPASALGTLTNLSWSSTAATGSTGTSYTFGFTTSATGSNVSSITMSVPAGTTGTPTLGTVTAWQPSFSPETLPGQSVALTGGNTITFSFTSTFINPSSVFSIQVNGLTTSSTTGASTSTITTKNGATAVDTGTTPSLSIAPAALSGPYWYASSTVMGAASNYTYAFTTTTGSSLSSVTMTVPPGTGGTPAVGTVTGVPSGGAVALSGQILTYTFTGTTVPANTVASIQITGLTNTNSGLAAAFGGEIVTKNGAALVDGGALTPLSFTVTGLSATSWSASSNTTGATSVAYTFGFTSSTSSTTISDITMTVPPGTSGTPAVGAVSAQYASGSITFPSSAVSLSGTTLDFSFTPTFLQPSTIISIEITGLTNTSTPGAYPSSMVTVSNTATTNLPPPFQSGLAPAVTFTSTTLTALSWSVSSTTTGATGVSYTYSFGLSAGATLSSITMSVPPGTGGTPAVGSVTPSGIAGGSVSLVGQTLTYSFTAAAVSSSSTITVVITGMTNTSTPSVYAASVIANNGGSAVASGTTPAITFTSGALTSLSWSASDTSTGATSVAYTYGFTTATGVAPTSITMTVPAGTGGTPTLGPVTIYDPTSGAKTPTAQSVALAGTTLTYSLTVPFLNPGTVFTIEIDGMTNTSSGGAYSSAITTKNGTASVDSGTTPLLSFSSSVLGSPTWSVSSTAVGATATTYTYGFTMQSAATINTVTMTVPAGTAGTPAVGTVTPASVAASGHATLSGTTLTYTFTAAALATGAPVSIGLTGITNTSTAGIYSSNITANNSGTAVASGTTPSVNF